MTHSYKVSGMTCSGCEAKVESLLSKVNHVENVSINLLKGEAIIEMTEHIPTTELKTALQNYPKYKIEKVDLTHEMKPASLKESTSWVDTYKPILIIGIYIIGITFLIGFANGNFIWQNWMQDFMAAFFLVFSFFKFLDLRGFADGYSTYDIIAGKWKEWSYVYAFVELGLGILYLLKFNPLFTNAITFVVMSISIIGVLRSILNKRQIKCACLGAVFNLPMSTVTIVEDAVMIVMSAATIIYYL
jgi:cation transport ATPase